MIANSRWVRVTQPYVLVIALILIGACLRISLALHEPYTVDEAESSINALTLQQHGYPTSEYMGLPIYENTLTEGWEGNPEYEFRDSSYSPQGVAVYHGWLPFYAIAASEMLMGVTPDQPQDPPRLLHGRDVVLRRMLAPRLPAVVFSIGMMFVVYLLGRELGGVPTGLAALTWMALDSNAVDFGYKARYYSLTILMSVAVAYALWRTTRTGKWRDFLILGVVEGLLFHTHQLSAVVFGVASLAAIPRIIRHERWMPKAAAAVAIAGSITIPWAALSGFFETASSVPKIFELFESWIDYIYYVLKRPISLMVLVVALLLALAARLLPGRLGRKIAELVSPNVRPMLFLLWWMVVIYAAFHLLVPAASFFPKRLTLMMITPYVLLVSVIIGAVCQLLNNRWSGLSAVIVTVAVLLFSFRLERPLDFRSTLDYGPLIDVLKERKIEPGTRFYASPNHHLVWTYFTGIPVQSVAPVRREFLESYPHPIVFLETVVSRPLIEARKISAVAAEHGETPDAETIKILQDAIWFNQALEDVSKRNIPTPAPATYPPYLDELVATEKSNWEKGEDDYIKEKQRNLAYFREVDVDRASDLWLAFFYRFSGYKDRVGTKANIISRLRDAEIIPVPELHVVVYFCHPPVPAAPVGEDVSQ